MMPVLLINLDRSVDRLRHMEREFARVGVPFTRLPAFDASAIRRAEAEQWIEQRPGFAKGEWLIGDIGAFSSHRNAWLAAAAASAEATAIFEDDVHLASDLRALLSDPSWIPPDADIVRLEANSKMVLRCRQKLGVTPTRSLYRAASGTWGAAGYIITKAAASRLAGLPPEQHTFIDSFLFKPTRSPVAAGLCCYQISPALCIQDDYLNGRSASIRSVVNDNSRLVTAPPKPRFYDGLFPGRKRAVPFRA